MNPAAVGLFGANGPDQLLGRSLLEPLHAENHGSVREHFLHWRAGRTALPLDAKIVLPDGRVRDISVTGAQVADEGDRAIQLIVRDITEQKAAERALRESEERLALAVAGAQEGVWDWNLETNAVVYSTRWKQMLGYSDEEIEPHVSAWERLAHPDDKSRADRANDSVARGERQPTRRSSVSVTRTGITSTCSLAAFRCAASPAGRSSASSAPISISRSGNGPRRRCARTRNGSNWRSPAHRRASGTGTWKRARSCTPRAGRRCSGTPTMRSNRTSARGSGCSIQTMWSAAQQVNESVERGAATYEGEFRLRHKDGHYVHVLSRGYPVRRDPAGPVVRIVGTHFDLTERKRAEAERARTELLTRLVFAQEDERRRIAREMHDQFGEQLTALALRIRMLKDACGDRDDVARARRVHRSHRPTSRPRRGHLVWELRPTALDDLGLRAALANYVQDWSNRVGISATLHTSGLLDDRLPSDAETALYRIAQEALTNVAKHARAPECRRHSRASRRSPCC